MTLLSPITDIAESYYRGQVCVSLKDSVFSPSYSFPTVFEMINVIRESNREKGRSYSKSIFLITDGGPEHRVTYHSVKIPLILMFKEFQTDRLIAMRTASNGICANIVERMSLLNICYQNMALEREETEEELIKKCYKFARSQQKSELKDAWEELMKNILSTLQSRTVRMALKQIPFKTFKVSEYHRNSLIHLCQ